MYSRQTTDIFVRIFQFFKENLCACRTCKSNPLISVHSVKCLPKLRLLIQRNSSDRRQFQHFCPSFSKFICSTGTASLRSGYKHFPSCKRKIFIPSEVCSKLTYFTDYNNCRCLDSLPFYLFFQSGNGCYNALLISCRSLLENCRRHIRIHSCIKKPLTDICKCCNSHKKNQRSLRICQRFKINVIFFPCSPVSGNDMHR